MNKLFQIPIVQKPERLVSAFIIFEFDLEHFRSICINVSATTIESHEGLFEGTIKLFVHDKEKLDELVERLLNLKGIENVTRFETEAVA